MSSEPSVYRAAGRRLALFTLGLLVLSTVFVSPAGAGPGFFFGVNDDTMKWSATPEKVAAAGTDLGVRAFRVTLPWTRGQRTLAGSNMTSLDHVVAARGAQRIVVNAGWLGASTPVNAVQRAQFCGYVRSTLVRYPQIRDVVIWNEVNKSMFFRPQYTQNGKPESPVLYEKLLATCYDTLHGLRGKNVNVITSVSPRGNNDPHAVSNVSISPVTFVRELGRVYRASGRRKPLFDTWGQNAYGSSYSEPVSKQHAGGTISEGDYGKLMSALNAAFRSTAQPVPSARGHVRIWYLETGFQTSLDPVKAPLYQGTENVSVLSPAAQAQQLAAAIKLAYCQPAVQALFNFELADDPALSGWQSGVLWADWTPKPSYATVRAVAVAADAGTLRCG